MVDVTLVHSRRPTGTLGSLYVLSVPFLAGLASLVSIRIGGFKFFGWVWVVFLVTGPLICLLQRQGPRFPLIWLPLFWYLIVSLLLVGNRGFGNWQAALQTVTPFIVGLVASCVVRTPEQLKALKHGFFASLGPLLLVFWLWVASDAYDVAERTLSMTAGLVGCVFLANMKRGPWLALLGWGVCLLISVWTGSRMATFGLLMLWVLYPAYRTQRTRVLAGVASAGLGLGFLFIPSFLERFFPQGGGSVGRVLHGEVSGTGRFEVWPLLLQESKKHIVLGAGVGESSKFVPLVWEGIYHPHNEYIRILFECGIVGLCLLLVALFGQLLLLRGLIRRSDGELKTISVAAYMSLIFMMTISLTDNPFVCGAAFMHPLFTLLGAAHGAAALQARPVRFGRPVARATSSVYKHAV